MRRSSGTSRPRTYWCTRSGKDGGPCASSWGSKCQTNRSHTSTTARSLGGGSGGFAGSPSLWPSSASRWLAFCYCVSVGTEESDSHSSSKPPPCLYRYDRVSTKGYNLRPVNTPISSRKDLHIKETRLHEHLPDEDPPGHRRF